MVEDAIRSALSQTVPCEVIVSDHGSTDATPAILRTYHDKVRYLRREEDRGVIFAWLDGVINANTEFVHITYDDDWIDPAFIGETVSLMDDDCSFVITDAVVHSDGGRDTRLYHNLFPPGTNDASLIERYLLDAPLTISPGCALLRREDVLSALNVTGVPMGQHRYDGVGPDLLMFLNALLRRRKFAFVNKALAHFREHAGSITINAFGDPEKLGRVVDSYTSVKKYYLMMKWARRTNIPEFHWKCRQVWRKLSREFGRVARAVQSRDVGRLDGSNH